MGVKKMIAAATLPALIASPVLAAGDDNPASSLSLRGEAGDANSIGDQSTPPPQPVPIPPIESASAGGISSYVLIGGAVVALVVVGAVVLGSRHNNSKPASA
jgi:hypothetical protein